MKVLYIECHYTISYISEDVIESHDSLYAITDAG